MPSDLWGWIGFAAIVLLALYPLRHRVSGWRLLDSIESAHRRPR